MPKLRFLEETWELLVHISFFMLPCQRCSHHLLYLPNFLIEQEVWKVTKWYSLLLGGPGCSKEQLITSQVKETQQWQAEQWFTDVFHGIQRAQNYHLFFESLEQVRVIPVTRWSGKLVPDHLWMAVRGKGLAVITSALSLSEEGKHSLCRKSSLLEVFWEKPSDLFRDSK